MMTYDELRGRVEGFLAAKQMTATAFGREALGDPTFVFELRRGRKPNLDVISRIITFMDKNPPPESAAA